MQIVAIGPPGRLTITLNGKQMLDLHEWLLDRLQALDLGLSARHEPPPPEKPSKIEQAAAGLKPRKAHP